MISTELHWDDFAKPRREEWNNEFAKSLKGLIPFYEADHNIRVESLYTRSESGHNNGRPGATPFTRGIRTGGNHWTTMEYIAATDPEKANRMAMEALREGIGGLRFVIGDQRPEILPLLLRDIQLPYIQAEFVISSGYSEWLQAISSFSGEPGLNNGVGVFLINGDDYDGLTSLAQSAKAVMGIHSLPRIARIDATVYANRGAGVVNRLALALAGGHELFLRLLQAGFSPDDAGALIQADISVGPDFLTEIAGLRAFRRLWSEVAAKYRLVHSCSAGIRVHTETAIWNFTVADRYNNLIRAAGSAMAAVLGNCDSHVAMPYDLVSLPADPNSAHLARSIQFLLKDESFFDRVGDPAGGSYFIEELTDALCEAAWARFMELEYKGGLAGEKGKALAEEWVSRDVQALKEEFRSGKRSWIGVNRFPPKTAENLEKRELEKPRFELENELKQNGY